MGQPTKDRKFVNGLFAKRFWRDSNDPDNEMFNIGIKKDEFIKNLQALPADKDGFVNLTMGSQKKDRAKLSLWEQERSNQSSNSSSTSSTATYSTATSTASSSSSTTSSSPAIDDDLPF